MEHLPQELQLAFEQIDVLSKLGSQISVSKLSGGLTNSNYKIVSPTDVVVVRIGADNADMLAIDRRNERIASEIAAEAGVGAKVLGYLESPPVLVLEYLDGRTYGVEDLQQSATACRIAKVLRGLHRAKPFPSRFDMREIRRQYLSIVLANKFYLPPDYLDFESRVVDVEQALSVHPEPIVPCHNDLLAENFMEVSGNIFIIDYEYSGNNEASFDIGNMASESRLELDTLARVCETYWGRHDESKVARARLWGILAKYGWMLWASIQDGAASIDFDFIAWGMEKYLRFRNEITEHELDTLIELVTR
jgi:thiamine kinase-like enzyme